MKYFIISIVVALLIGCESVLDNSRTCGVSNPAGELPWLKNIIAKADSDKVSKAYKGNYLGVIYLERFNNQDVFYSTMTMYSGGLYFHAFYCDGSPIVFINNKDIVSFLNGLKKDKVMYSNEP